VLAASRPADDLRSSVRASLQVGLRVPYLIRSPRHAATSYGKRTRHFAEALDLCSPGEQNPSTPP
jgi:hypothetical protein